MDNQLTFYLPRNSPLHRLTPTTKLLSVLTVIVMTFGFRFYWLPTILFFVVILPAAALGKVGGPFGRLFSRILLPAIVFLFLMQSFFYPGGETVIFKIWFLKVCRESVIYGYQISSRIAVMVSAFILFLLSTHPSDLMIDLTSRGVPAMFSYVITTSLQIIPQMRLKAHSIIDAQRSRGLETEGKLKDRVKALVPLVRPLVFGSLVDVEERTIAVEARGFASSIKKTYLKQIVDKPGDVFVRWADLLLILLTLGSRLWR